MIEKLKFYRCRKEYNTYEKHIPAPYIRKTFDADNTKKAWLSISGLGFYKVYINGTDITKGLLAPYISNPDDIVYFDKYDITPYLINGKNAIGIVLGNGMQNAHGGRVWDFDIAAFRNSPCFAFVVENDGDIICQADDTCKWQDSPIIFDDLRSGCFYDATKEIIGWNMPEFDDTDWQFVTTAENPRGERRYCEADPIIIESEISPVTIEERTLCERFNNRENMRLDTEFKFGYGGKKGVMFDFGINTAGIFRLKIDGKKGQEIFIQFCEHITPEGEPYYGNTGSFYPDGYGQTAYYVCKGEKDETFVPDFTYIGYRCAVVFGLEPEQIRPETLTMLVAHSDLPRVGTVKTSDEVMTKLIAMADNSDYSNFYYFPTDCPHREKNGWTGDAAVSAEHILLTKKADNSYKEWLRNICASQHPDGSIPGIIPTAGWGFAWGNGPAWDNVLTELCYRMYTMRGDLECAEICKESMLRYLSYISQKRRPDGLISIGLGDWLQPGKGAGDPTAPIYITDSIMSMYIAQKSAVLFDALGLDIQKELAQKLADSFRNALRTLIDFSDMSVCPRCQSVQSMYIYYNVFEPAEMKAATKELVRLVHEKDDHFCAGMLGLRVLFHVLSDAGYGELAYKMITREDFPSYGMHIVRGMTALPEDFISDEEFADTEVNSLNHHFMGDITSWYIQKVVGLCVNPRKTSPNDFVICPDFIADIDEASAEYEAPGGKISVAWKKCGDEYKLNVDFDGELTGYIKLHKGFMFKNEERHWERLHGSDCTILKGGEYTIAKRH